MSLSTAAKSVSASGDTSECCRLSTHLNNIGALYHHTGRSDAAKEKYEEALQLRMRVFRPNNTSKTQNDTTQRQDVGIQQLEAASAQENKLWEEMGRLFEKQSNKKIPDWRRPLDLFVPRSKDNNDSSSLYHPFSEPLISKYTNIKNCRSDSAVILYNMGLVQHENGDLEKANALYDMANTLVDQKSNPFISAIVLHVKARIYFVWKNLSGALKLLSDASDLLQNLMACQEGNTIKNMNENELNTVEKTAISVLSLMGHIYYQRGDINRALDLCEKVLSLIALPCNSAISASVLFNVGLVLQECGSKRKESTSYCEKFLDIALPEITHNARNTKKYGVQFADALETVALMHLENNSPTHAIKRFFKALRIRQDAVGPDNLDVAATSYQLGQVLHMTGQNKDAMSCYRDCLRIIVQANAGSLHSEDVATILCSMGHTHQDCGELDKALDTYKEALRITRVVRGDNNETVLDLLSIIGYIYLERGEVDDASANFADASRIMGLLQNDDNGVSSIVTDTTRGIFGSTSMLMGHCAPAA